MQYNLYFVVEKYYHNARYGFRFIDPLSIKVMHVQAYTLCGYTSISIWFYEKFDFVLAAKMTESMLRLKNKVSFRHMEGYAETGR